MMDNNEAWRHLQSVKASYAQAHGSDVADLKQQLAAERAKVALAVEALKPLIAEVGGMIGIEEQAFRDLLGNTNVNCLKQRWLNARSALAVLQSSAALVEIRREVAREILGLADGSGYISAKLIRREFGVTE